MITVPKNAEIFMLEKSAMNLAESCQGAALLNGQVVFRSPTNLSSCSFRDLNRVIVDS